MLKVEWLPPMKLAQRTPPLAPSAEGAQAKPVAPAVELSLGAG